MGVSRVSRVEVGADEFYVLPSAPAQPWVFFDALYDAVYDGVWRTGASGTGRTTFVNTLCESEVLAHKVSDNPDMAHIEEGIKIKPVNVGA